MGSLPCIYVEHEDRIEAIMHEKMALVFGKITPSIVQ